MSFQINKPGDTGGYKARLSSFGRRVVAGLIILTVVVSFIAYSRVLTNRKTAELRDAVVAAIDRAAVVCTNALSAVGAGDQAAATLRGHIEHIDSAKAIEDKVSRSYEMISFALSLVGSNQAQVDELNGARNRILLAMQEYAKPR